MVQALSYQELWRMTADAWLDTLTKDTFVTADDLVAAIGLPDNGVYKNNAVGAWFATKSRAGKLAFVGFTKSARVIGHGNTIRRWRVV